MVCGGFAMPMRKGYADHVFVLTSGETMSLYAAANIGLALENFQGRGYARLSGIILNRRDVPDEDRRVAALAEELGVSVTGTLSRSPMVLKAEKRESAFLQHSRIRKWLRSTGSLPGLLRQRPFISEDKSCFAELNRIPGLKKQMRP